MNRELASTSAARWASHDSTAWIVLGSPGGTRPPWWPRWCRGTWRRAGRRRAWPACRRPRRPASRGRGRRRAATRRAASTAARGGGWPRRRGRRGRRRAATAGRCGPAARAPRRSACRPAHPGWASVSRTTSCPAAASAWLSPSTWAATPPTERGGKSQVSIRTRIASDPNRSPWPVRLGPRSVSPHYVVDDVGGDTERSARGVLDQRSQPPQVADPDPLHHGAAADGRADAAAEPPRERQVLLPREPRAAGRRRAA